MDVAQLIEVVGDDNLARSLAEFIEAGECSNSSRLLSDLASLVVAIGVAGGFPDPLYDRIVVNALREARARIGVDR